MFSHETLALVADSYNPVVGICALIVTGNALLLRNWKIAIAEILALTWGLTVVYGLMFFEKNFRCWERFGLDYSTHSAFAFSGCWFLCQFAARDLRCLIVGSLVGYLTLIVYQGYHGVRDILSTLAVIAPSVSWLSLLFARESLGKTSVEDGIANHF